MTAGLRGRLSQSGSTFVPGAARGFSRFDYVFEYRQDTGQTRRLAEPWPTGAAGPPGPGR